MISLRAIEENQCVIHCKKEKDAIKLCEILDENGYMWGSASSYKTYTNWGTYRENTCYNIASGGYADLSTYSYRKFPIIDVSEVLEFNTNRIEVELI